MKRKKIGGERRRNKKRYVVERDGGRCLLCGSEDNLTLDHILPYSRGGSYSVDNLQLLCEPCNKTKGSKSRVDWRWRASYWVAAA